MPRKKTTKRVKKVETSDDVVETPVVPEVEKIPIPRYHEQHPGRKQGF